MKQTTIERNLARVKAANEILDRLRLTYTNGNAGDHLAIRTGAYMCNVTLRGAFSEVLMEEKLKIANNRVKHLSLSVDNGDEINKSLPDSPEARRTAN